MERWVGRSCREHQDAVEANRTRRGGGHSRVVGLRGAARDDDVGALRERVGHQELEIARFIAAEGQAREVVPLDEDSWTARGSVFRRAAGVDDGRRQRGERHSRRFEWHLWQRTPQGSAKKTRRSVNI